MELIFGEGCDGDMQALIFDPLAEGGLNITVSWKTAPNVTEHAEACVYSVSNANGGEIDAYEVDDNYEPTDRRIVIPIDDIESLEIH